MNGRREGVLAWFASGLLCIYFAWSYAALLRYTRVFMTLFGSLGVELPAPTRFLIATHFFLYPLLFVGAGVLVIAKEFLVPDKRLSLIISLVVALLTLLAVDSIKSVFILPLLELAQKLR
jgi:hypothetical protein